MHWSKKITKLFSVAFLLLFLFSCDGDGCIDADEFDNEVIKVDANPITDGVFGSYNNNSGGQVAEWHPSGLLSNGGDLLIHVTGNWTPWYGTQMTNEKLTALPLCKLCPKKGEQSVGNCICHQGETPQPEIGINGLPVQADCSVAENQNDPNKCTCTLQNGSATDYGVFHFPLGFYNKDHTVKLPDEQAPACRYNAGMGLYLAMFGRSSSEMPSRAYHLFSESTICPITRNSNGQCIDSRGIDRTRYVFRSANGRTLMKDDHNGNDGTDTNTSDDTYHKANEYMKLIIHDQYYSDNFGYYNVIFLKGLNREGDTGLLEYLVKIVEDSVLGKVDEDGKRHGSVIEYMYKAIVQDTYFAATIQICLSLYIAFFGLATLFGLADINSKKELMSRVMKIALVIFFTNPNSWYFYNQIIVGFFKDSMDFLVTFITTLGESNLDDETNLIKIAQSANATPDSNASRFSYIDTIIKMLFSENVTKKIWGLFFSSFFGFIYIIAIYLLIAYFLYVMLLAATIYTITLIKLVFVLALGPLFISFSLFPQTSGMFKKWLAFCGARSLEVILLFLILYPFVMLIDQKIIGLLSFRTCFEHIDLGLFSFSILHSYPSRSFADWIHDLVTIGGLLFILQMIMDQIPKLCEALISIQGESGGDSKETKGTASLANSMMKFAAGAGASAVSSALSTGGAVAFRGARFASRHSGLSGAMDKVFDKIPMRGPRARLRDSVIDDALKQAQAKHAKSGLTGADLEKAVRNSALNDPKFGLNAYKYGNSSDPKAAGGRTKAALLGMTADNIAKRLDKKLVEDPLKKFLKDKAKEMRSKDGAGTLLGRDAQLKLQAEANAWAEKNILGGKDAIAGNLSKMNSFMKGELELSAKEAAKKFAGDEAGKNRYMQHLLQSKEERKRENEGKLFKFNFKGATDFARKVGFEEKRGKGFVDKHLGINTGKGLNPLERIGFLDRYRSKYGDQKQELKAAAARDYVSSAKYGRDKEKLEQFYARQKAEFEEGPFTRKLDKKLEARLGELSKDFEAMKKIMMDDAKAKMKAEIDALGKDDAAIMKRKAEIKAEYDQMMANQIAKLEELAANPKTPTDVNGGPIAYREGTINFNGNTLAEAEARLSAFGIGGDMMGKSDISAAILPSAGIDSLGGDIGAALSVTSNGGKVDNSVTKAVFDNAKSRADTARRMKKQEAQYIELDISEEEAKGDQKDEAKIKNLKAKLDETKKEEKYHESEIANLDQRLHEINNA